MKRHQGRSKKICIAAVALLLSFQLSGCGKVTPPDGTWETASMGYEYYGISQPEYYVQFTDTEIQYKHMKEDELVLDHTNKIVSLKQTKTGGYVIQAETSEGGQYTYRSDDSDPNVLEYYWTWNEDEFSKSYSAGASLWKLTSPDDAQ